MSEVRLQVKNLCKSFGITKAVQNVSFNVNKGEVHALIGENGSGKSTLTNMLTGIYSIGSGTFILDGKEIHPKNQVEANNEGVSIIVQELGTLSGLTVAENIFLGHEEQFVHFGIKNTKAMNRKATELLKKYGFDRIKASDIIDNYNFEDRKLVEIVKATYFDPKIVVVDETTTALSQEGRDELYKHMDRIRNSGNSVIFISHDLPEVLEKSDTITILRDGIYNQNLQAVPPTGSISYINHSTSSIHPIASKIEIRKEGKLGRVYYPAAYMTNENLEYYKDAYEIGWKAIVDTYAEATQHVDQGLSLTLFFPDTATTRDLNKAQIYAWRKGIKTLYYIRIRQQALEGTEVQGCVSCML